MLSDTINPSTNFVMIHQSQSRGFLLQMLSDTINPSTNFVMIHQSQSSLHEVCSTKRLIVNKAIRAQIKLEKSNKSLTVILFISVRRFYQKNMNGKEKYKNSANERINCDPFT